MYTKLKYSQLVCILNENTLWMYVYWMKMLPKKKYSEKHMMQSSSVLPLVYRFESNESF